LSSVCWRNWHQSDRVLKQQQAPSEPESHKAAVHVSLRVHIWSGLWLDRERRKNAAHLSF
jgi:hypothetical protein